MNEHFVVAMSGAAPIFSDRTFHYVAAMDPPDPERELIAFARDVYKHPSGLYSAAIYESADAFHKNQDPLHSLLSDRAYSENKARAERYREHLTIGIPPKTEDPCETVL